MRSWPCPKWHLKPSRSSSSPQCRLSRSADRGRITAAKGVLASTLLNAKMRNETPYGLVNLTDMRTQRPLEVRKTASAHGVPFGTGPLSVLVKRYQLLPKYCSNSKFTSTQVQLKSPDVFLLHPFYQGCIKR